MKQTCNIHTCKENHKKIKIFMEKLIESIIKEFEKVYRYTNRPMEGERKLKSFLSSALTRIHNAAVEETRIILIKVLNEVEKEHGSSSVYFDMIEELFTEEINNLFKNN